MQVPRSREPLLAIPFLSRPSLAGALAAVLVLMLVIMGAPASAQDIPDTTDTTGAIGGADAALMRPVLDGDPQNPPRFRSARTALDTAPARFGQLPNFSYQPALGAGTTGFDSTNAKKRRAKPSQILSGQAKSTQPAAPGGAADPGTTPPADAQLAIKRSSPKQLQPAGAPLPGRIYNPTRPGAPPAALDAAVVTIATTPPSLRPPPEEKPFDPLGVQLGAFIFRPAMEYTRGFDNNPARNTSTATQ